MEVLTGSAFKTKTLDLVVNRRKTGLPSILATVRKIIMDVRENGDAALLRYTEKFDNVTVAKSKLKVNKKDVKEAYQKLTKAQIAALKRAATNIEYFHKKQLRDAWSLETETGVTVGQVPRPLSSVGIYSPGGKASYPSSLLMCAIPAKVAKVKKVVVCSPPNRKGRINPALLVAADLTGVDEMYRVGGAQAIAAMAYGTETVPAVDKIVGPGNVFVTTAKLEVTDDVAIDIPAGPSEVLIIADETASPSLTAADLLAQAEHDPHAWAILLTTSNDLAVAVRKEVYKQMEFLSKKETVKSSIQHGGLIVTVENLEEAVEYANLIAAEHLQIIVKNPHKLFDKIQNAGAVFLGSYSPVAFGDYTSGLNHILPTGGFARVYSGLSTKEFIKTINFMECNKRGYLNLRRTTITLAKMEGFDGHAKTVSMRERLTR